MSHRQNIARIKAVHFALEELAAEVVFVGGATVSLYSTIPEIETRSTDDVDIVVEIMRYSEYAAIEEKFAKLIGKLRGLETMPADSQFSNL